MRKILTFAIMGLMSAAIFSSVAKAQTPPSQNAAAEPHNPWKYYPRDVQAGVSGGPAPKRDLSGTWAGPGSSAAVPRGGAAEKPELTPFGQEMMAKNKPIGKFGPGGSNDPHVRYCDPYGFPQNMYNENRAMTIANGPDRIFVLLQYMDMWREIWTDGRALPTKVGGYDKDSLDPIYNGYSTGHWEDDYNFVVETTGMTDATWVTSQGLPHSLGAKVTERYTRVDKNSMKVSITIEDPKVYVKPFSLGTYNFRWLPTQKMDEWLCPASELFRYLKEQADPAGSTENMTPQSLGNGRRGEGQ